VFQGLRIAVNDEMAALEAVLEAAAKVVRPGGDLKEKPTRALDAFNSFILACIFIQTKAVVKLMCVHF
jgi:hypothetical protein